MKRQVIAAIALAGLLMLTGCSYDNTIGVVPEVEAAKPVEDGSYQLQVTADAYMHDTGATLSDVRIHGYTLTGEQVCVARFGNLSGVETQTITCESFPSLIVSDTVDRNETIPNEGIFAAPDYFDIITIAKLYRGVENGTHQFDVFEALPDWTDWFTYKTNQPVPTETGLQVMQCDQWRYQNRGANLSAVGKAPWLSWEKRPPKTNRVYELRFNNYTNTQRMNRTEHALIDQDAKVHSMSEVPPELGQEVRDVDNSWGGINQVNRTAFYGIVSGLANQYLNSTEDLSATMTQINGTVGDYDNTRINCRANPPQHTGSRGQYMKVFVDDGDVTWVVDVRTEQTYRGPAFENVTGIGTTS